MALPPGQLRRSDFPRFGLNQYANRFPDLPSAPSIEVAGDVSAPQTFSAALDALPQQQQTSDFHCVTTWSTEGLNWQGVRFADFYQQLVVPNAGFPQAPTFAVLASLDGYRTTLPLTDLLAPDVLLATHLNDAPLDRTHGAPLRLVAPAHYGYKNAKHLHRIEFWQDESKMRWPGYKFMDHPRARVALEERGRGLPGSIFRWLYRPLVARTIKQFANSNVKQT